MRVLLHRAGAKQRCGGPADDDINDLSLDTFLRTGTAGTWSHWHCGSPSPSCRSTRSARASPNLKQRLLGHSGSLSTAASLLWSQISCTLQHGVAWSSRRRLLRQTWLCGSIRSQCRERGDDLFAFPIGFLPEGLGGLLELASAQ